MSSMNSSNAVTWKALLIVLAEAISCNDLSHLLLPHFYSKMKSYALSKNLPSNFLY